MVDPDEGASYVYDDILEAAATCDPDSEFIAACKVREGKLNLSVEGRWIEVDAYRAE